MPSKRNIGFIDNENINPRYNCNRSKLHLNKRGTNLLIENILFSLYNDINDWHNGTVSKNSSCKSKSKPNKNLSLLDDSIFPFLTKLRSEHPKNVLLGHLNINSVRNKFESTNELIRNNFDNFIITAVNLIQVSQIVIFMFLAIDYFEKIATKMEVILCVT